MARSLNELRQLQRTQLKALNKDALIDSILAASDNDVGHHPLHEKLERIAAELSDLKKSIISPDSTINRKLAGMQDQIDKQAEVIARQQSYLEALDRKERETKLVVLGVPDEGETLAGASRDEEKLKKVWEVLDEDVNIRSYQRLGRPGDGGRKRPILVTVETRHIRDTILAKTRKLKDAGRPYERIFVKKDVHPSIRKEWKRLRDAEAAEKDRPENEGCVIRLDFREKKLYRDGEVIDRWNPTPF